MKEIVTVQVGGFANFVGSHFWNFQDELLGLAEDPYADSVFKKQHLDMDVLYRTGETQQGILTYTPRLVSIGFQGSLGSVSSHGTLYNREPTTTSDVTTWTAGVSTHTAERHEKNLFLRSLYEEQDKSTTVDDRTVDTSGPQREYQDKDIVESLEKGVKFWTDFSKVDYHPQSLFELRGLWMDDWEFDNYGIGRDALAHGLREEEISERLRFFVEECDRVQGFQFMVDDSGGFSAVAAELLENIADEYSNTPVLLYALRAPESYVNLGKRKQTIMRSLHDALSFSQLSSYCNLVVPVGLPSLSTSRASSFFCIEDEKPYHCSAIYAAALHSISLPFRMGSLVPTTDLHYVSGAVDVNDVVQILSGQSRRNKVAIMDMAMPAPSLTGKDAGEKLLNYLHPVTPEIAENVEDLQAVETMTIHGVLGPGTVENSCLEACHFVFGGDVSLDTRGRLPMMSHIHIENAKNWSFSSANCLTFIEMPIKSETRRMMNLVLFTACCRQIAEKNLLLPYTPFILDFDFSTPKSNLLLFLHHLDLSNPSSPHLLWQYSVKSTIAAQSVAPLILSSILLTPCNCLVR